MLSHLPDELGELFPCILVCIDTQSSEQSKAVLLQWYEELGGEVVRLGKPAAVLYEEALRMLGLRKSEVLAIGDSLQHDIAGALRRSSVGSPDRLGKEV